MTMARRRKERRISAAERRKERAARTHQEQLDRLDRMFGKGKGAAKERARLAKLIEKGEIGIESQKEE